MSFALPGIDGWYRRSAACHRALFHGAESTGRATVRGLGAAVYRDSLYTTAPAVGSMARYNLTNTVQTGDVGCARPATSPTTSALTGSTPGRQTGLLQLRRQEWRRPGAVLQRFGNPPFDAQAAAVTAGRAMSSRVDRDIMVLANPEIAGLPNWVIALVAAGGIAAALSTAAGLLLVISAAVSHDLVKGIFVPEHIG